MFYCIIRSVERQTLAMPYRVSPAGPYIILD